MQTKFLNILSLGMLFCLAGCSFYNRSLDNIDLYLYKSIGRTIFSSPSTVDIKQIHLGRVGSFQEKVVVRGKVSQVHNMGTYLLLTQGSIQLLVDLSNLPLVRQDFVDEKPNYLEIVGGIERSFKGVPFLKAGAYKRIAQVDTN